MSLFKPSTTDYFRKSPFSSWYFDIATTVLILFVVSVVRTVQLQPETLKASQAVLGLALVPVAVWVLALMMHWEMRAIVEELEDATRTRTKLPQERLARLHYGLVLGITIMSYAIIHALTTTIH